MFLNDIIPFVDGIDLQTDAATVTFNTGIYGFNYPKTANNLAIDNQSFDDSEGPRFTLAVTHEVVGGQVNGPHMARGAIWGAAIKKDYLTTDVGGEVDVAYFEVVQGNTDDAGGLLIGAHKVFDVGGTGGLTPIEISSNRVNKNGDLISSVHSVGGFQEGLGGALFGEGCGWYAEARHGNPRAGLAVVNWGGAFEYAIACYSDRNPAARYFSVKWDGQPSAIWGGPTDNMQIRYDGTINTMFWRDQTNSFNAAALTKTGEFSAKLGVRVSDGSVLIKRYLRSKVSVDFQNVPAHNTERKDVDVPGACMDDGVEVNPSSNYINDKLIFTGRVYSPNVVRLTAHNIGTTDVDPGPQDLIIWVKGV